MGWLTPSENNSRKRALGRVNYARFKRMSFRTSHKLTKLTGNPALFYIMWSPWSYLLLLEVTDGLSYMCAYLFVTEYLKKTQECIPTIFCTAYRRLKINWLHFEFTGTVMECCTDKAAGQEFTGNYHACSGKLNCWIWTQTESFITQNIKTQWVQRFNNASLQRLLSALFKAKLKLKGHGTAWLTQ